MPLSKYFTPEQRMKAEELYDDVWIVFEPKEKDPKNLSDIDLESYLEACGFEWYRGEWYHEETIAASQRGEELPY